MTDQAGPIFPEGFQDGNAMPENRPPDPLVRILSLLPVTISFIAGLFPVMLEGQSVEPVHHILSKNQGLKSSTEYCTHEYSQGYL